MKEELLKILRKIDNQTIKPEDALKEILYITLIKSNMPDCCKHEKIKRI